MHQVDHIPLWSDHRTVSAQMLITLTVTALPVDLVPSRKSFSALYITLYGGERRWLESGFTVGDLGE
ncbi:hypothetical protein PC9H_006288 [Pleurotus ostreatus]|uniref:Uncharacterized protein n=1 Tax=Pleurotus ostreatus TaxID=5322 RepID=A0A8H6ZVZ5_PLEOS|nr:uncharacterized protein PC9H_006288 [Pleurotus ostreatus]KAF7430580.1 hypothetical protein PC9H_006288 [Pleurotus ostreatus]